MEEVGPHGSNPTAISGTSWKKKKTQPKCLCCMYEPVLSELTRINQNENGARMIKRKNEDRRKTNYRGYRKRKMLFFKGKEL